MRLGFLDGLRGWGAIFVVLYHVFVEGLPVSAGSAELLKRLAPFNGMLAVLIFFLVSGFSLSVRYLADGDRVAWFRMAAGRYFRLAIPIFASCLLVHLAMLAGMLDPAAQRLAPFGTGLDFEPTMAHLLRFSLFDVFFNYQHADTYIGPLWTMSVELIGSLFVLVAILLLRPLPCRPLLLLALALAISLSPLPGNFALLALFPIGAAMADGFNRGWFDRVPHKLALGMIAAGCLMAAVAPFNVSLPGKLAACLMVIGCIAAPQVRVFLDGNLSAWLGRLSFPLYLMHGPAMGLLGEPLLRNAGTSIGARLAIDLLTVAVSVVAAVLFVPVNEFAIRVSRFAGQRAASRFCEA